MKPVKMASHGDIVKISIAYFRDLWISHSIVFFLKETGGERDF